MDTSNTTTMLCHSCLSPAHRVGTKFAISFVSFLRKNSRMKKGVEMPVGFMFRIKRNIPQRDVRPTLRRVHLLNGGINGKNFMAETARPKATCNFRACTREVELLTTTTAIFSSTISCHSNKFHRARSV